MLCLLVFSLSSEGVFIAAFNKSVLMAPTIKNSAKTKASTHRLDFLQDRKDDPNLLEEERLLAAQMIVTENVRKHARKWKSIKGTGRGASISQVEVTVIENGETITRTLRSKEGVKTAIADTISARYRLTEPTPMMQPLHRDTFGLFAETPPSQALLQGQEIQADFLAPHVRDFLTSIQRLPGDPSPTKLSVSKEDFQDYWTKAKEDTSSSFSGLHFGHWKAAAKDDYLSEVHALFCEMTYGSGFALPRWKTRLTVMIEKKPGVIKVDKLRAILLMEADFNFMNKLIFGRQMIHSALESNSIPAESFGGIPGKSAIDLSFTRKQIMDTTRTRKSSLAIASVDASQCYDCIQHTVASMACQKWGVPLLAILSMLSSIQQMKFHLRTAHGDSDLFFGGQSTGTPFQGICQGNGGGPAVWLAVSALLVLHLHHRGETTTLPPTLGLVGLTLAGLIFVDDTDLLYMGDSAASPMEVVQGLQRSVEAWQSGLTVSGGALKCKKCSWALLTHRWNGGKASIMHKFPPHFQITVEDAGQRVAISRLKPNEPVTVVGVTMQMDGKMKGQIDSLRTNANKWAERMADQFLSPATAWYGIHHILGPSLRYPLPTTTLSLSQGDAIVSHLYRRLLPKMKINRCFPKLWRYASPSLGGLALPHPTIDQHIAVIRQVWQLSTSKETPSQALRISFEATQLHLGSTTDFFRLPYDTWAGLVPNNTTAKALWIALQDSNASLVLGEPLAPHQSAKMIGLSWILPSLHSTTPA